VLINGELDTIGEVEKFTADSVKIDFVVLNTMFKHNHETQHMNHSLVLLGEVYDILFLKRG
jgi:hypothetical protein